MAYLAYLFLSTIASEQSQSVSQPLWLEGLLLISKHIQEAFSHRHRAESTQLLGLVCGLRHSHFACIFRKPVSSLDATCQPCLWLEKLVFGIKSVCSLAAYHKASEHSQCKNCGGSCFEFLGSGICRSRVSPLDA